MTEFEQQNIRGDETDQAVEGLYIARLVPINLSVAGSTVGEFKIRIQGNEVRVRGEVENSPQVFHRQFIHAGRDCPGPGADTDIDGIISGKESKAITGEPLVALDPFPVPVALGAYTYFESSSLNKMLSDINMSDSDLRLSGRTIVIYGSQGMSTVPIACGTFFRSDS